MEREVGGGIGMGNTCKPMAVSFQCMTKSTTNKKKKRKKKKRICLMQETPVRSLGGEEPLEKEMATHSSILAWEIPWTAEPGYHPWGHKELDTI